MSLYLVATKGSGVARRKVPYVFHVVKKEWSLFHQKTETPIVPVAKQGREDYKAILAYAEKQGIREYEVKVDDFRYFNPQATSNYYDNKAEWELIDFIYGYCQENDVSIGLLLDGDRILFTCEEEIAERGIATGYAYKKILPCSSAGAALSCAKVNHKPAKKKAFPGSSVPGAKGEMPFLCYMAPEDGLPPRNRRGFLVDIPLGDIVLDEPFSEKLMKYLIESGKTNAEVYHKAGISKQVFSKIISTPEMIPTKGTVICLAIGLELSLKETTNLLSSAGYALSSSLIGDMIVATYLEKRVYDLDRINMDLSEYQCPLLGWRPREG